MLATSGNAGWGRDSWSRRSSFAGSRDTNRSQPSSRNWKRWRRLSRGLSNRERRRRVGCAGVATFHGAPGVSRHGVAAVRLHAEFERLDSLNEQERVERANAGSEIAQTLHARLNDVRQRPKHLGELHAVISRARLCDRRVLAGPWELAAIDDDAADGDAVPAQELGGRLHHDI